MRQRYNVSAIVAVGTFCGVTVLHQTPADAFVLIPTPVSSSCRSSLPSSCSLVKMAVDDGSSNNNDTGGGIIESAAKSLLASAFAALSEDDQYDAVLTGLCAKILDSSSSSPSSSHSSVDNNSVTGEEEEEQKRTAAVTKATEDATLSSTQKAFRTLADPLRLVREMNTRGVKASSRSVMALIDATATTQDPRAMSSVLSLTIQNGSVSRYGSLQSSVTPFPPTPTSSVLVSTDFTNGKRKRQTRDERLNALSDVPTDNRSVEVASALATIGVVGTCLFINGMHNLFGWDASTSSDLPSLYESSNWVLTGITSLVVLDTFYEGFANIVNFAITANSLDTKIPNLMFHKDAKSQGIEGKKTIWTLPPLLGLGKGNITSPVLKGFTRLLTVDTERECQCEAAAFFSAYALGLPCFAFRPNALEAAVLVFESNNNSNQRLQEEKSFRHALDPLLSDSGILKVLIWLMAPVAMESSIHPQLIASDPREGYGLLRRLQNKAFVMGAMEEIQNVIHLEEGDAASKREMHDLIKWAYTEADLLLRDHKKTVEELTNRLVGGAATVGDCVAVVEGW